MAKNAWGDVIAGPTTARRNAWGDAVEAPERSPVQVPPMNVDPAEGMSRTEKLLVGAGAAMTRAGNAVSDPFVSDETRAARKADRDLYARHHPGGWATAGEIGADVLMSAAPVAKSAQGASVLLKTLGAGRAAPVLGNVAANAAYGAATAPEDRGAAAMLGAAGAAGGHVLSKALGARAPRVAPGVKELADRGVPMTPGQLYGPGIVRGAEDKLTSLPIVGDLITRARKRSLESYNRAELLDAIAPLSRRAPTGESAKAIGRESVEAAERIVEQAYDEALERVVMSPQAAISAARSAVAEAEKSLPLLDPRQLGQLDYFVRKRIEPFVESLGDKPATGKLVKELDAEIGHYARKFAKSPSPSDHSLGDAFYILQAQWREAMQASGKTRTGRDALELLQGANAAYRNLLPIKLASERTATGVFTPQGMNAAGKSSKVGNSKLTEAARQVLPSTVPDSGTASRALWGISALGGGSALIDPVTTLGTAGATALATSGPAMRGMTKAATALSGKGLMDTLPPEVQRLLAKDPEIARVFMSMLAARAAEAEGR
jgi:hypothetical protein